MVAQIDNAGSDKEWRFSAPVGHLEGVAVNDRPLETQLARELMLWKSPAGKRIGRRG